MKQTLTQRITTGTKVGTIIRRLLTYYWVDHNGNNIVDHNGNKIVFTKRRT